MGRFLPWIVVLSHETTSTNSRLQAATARLQRISARPEHCRALPGQARRPCSRAAKYKDRAGADPRPEGPPHARAETAQSRQPRALRGYGIRHLRHTLRPEFAPAPAET